MFWFHATGCGIVAQTQAAEEVAPPGFKIHYDFNHNRTLASVVPLLKQLQENHPIVGWIEDPIISADLEGWASIKRDFKIPIIMQSPPLGPVRMLMKQIAGAFAACVGLEQVVVTTAVCLNLGYCRCLHAQRQSR